MTQRLNDKAASAIAYLARWCGVTQEHQQRLTGALESLAARQSGRADGSDGVDDLRLLYRIRNSHACPSVGFHLQTAPLFMPEGHPAPIADHTLIPLLKSLAMTRPRLLESEPWKGLPVVGVGVDASANTLLANLYWGLPGESAPERWRRAGLLVESSSPRTQIRRDDFSPDSLLDESWPTAVGVEFREDGSPGAVTVYISSPAARPDWLARWHQALGCTEAAHVARALLDTFPMSGASRYPAGSFVVGLKFEPNGPAPSLETHLAVRNFLFKDDAVTDGVRKLINVLTPSERGRALDLDALSGDRHSYRTAIDYALAGAGVGVDGKPYADILIAASARATLGSGSPRRTHYNVRSALEAAMDALTEKREGEAWRDFLLPAGSSDMWVTAYVLYQLTGPAWHYAPPRLRQSAGESARWLASHCGEKGGWAYSPAAQADADSTSLALLSLKRFGYTAQAEALAFLRSCLRADGGVSTYPAGSDEDEPQSGYFRSVVEITPLALAALGAGVESEDRAGAVRFLHERQGADGTWPAYWWVSPLYSTWVASSWLRGMHEVTNEDRLLDSLDRYTPVGTFEAALQLLCLCQFGQRAPRRHLVIERLLEEQNFDGSWKGDAMMRLPHHSTLDPRQEVDAGPSFHDVNGVFTTATAIAALSRCLA